MAEFVQLEHTSTTQPITPPDLVRPSLSRFAAKRRLANQLCRKAVAQVLFETARRYDAAQKWYLKMLLLMPDHLHILVGIPGDANLSNLIRDFKRITAKVGGIRWQRNFFDHRLRHDESEAEKFDYICQNPVRAGLVTVAHHWPYVFVCETAADFRGTGD
jgi:putative transposase